MQTLTKEASVMFPRFPEAGTCGGLSLVGAFISLGIAVIVIAAENLCSPVFHSVKDLRLFLPRLGLYLQGVPAGFLGFSFPLAISALICFANGHHNVKLI